MNMDRAVKSSLFHDAELALDQASAIDSFRLVLADMIMYFIVSPFPDPTNALTKSPPSMTAFGMSYDPASTALSPTGRLRFGRRALQRFSRLLQKVRADAPTSLSPIELSHRQTFVEDSTLGFGFLLQAML
jgi:hypothetical protein